MKRKRSKLVDKSSESQTADEDDSSGLSYTFGQFGHNKKKRDTRCFLCADYVDHSNDEEESKAILTKLCGFLNVTPKSDWAPKPISFCKPCLNDVRRVEALYRQVRELQSKIFRRVETMEKRIVEAEIVDTSTLKVNGFGSTHPGNESFRRQVITNYRNKLKLRREIRYWNARENPMVELNPCTSTRMFAADPAKTNAFSKYQPENERNVFQIARRTGGKPKHKLETIYHDHDTWIKSEVDDCVSTKDPTDENNSLDYSPGQDTADDRSEYESDGGPHSDLIHESSKNKSNKSEAQIPPKVGSSTCEICGRIYPRSIRVPRKHRWSHLGAEEKKDPQYACWSPPKFMCSTCGRHFHFVGAMKDHEKTHEPNYEAPRLMCQLCGKIFPNRHSLSSHITLCSRKAAGTHERFPCNYCSKTFTDGSSRASHMRNYHTNVTDRALPFTCPKCSKGYPNQKDWLQHKQVCVDEGRYIKKKRTSLELKMLILQELKSKTKRSEIAKKYNVTLSTICRVGAHPEKVQEEYASQNSDFFKCRKVFNKDLEEKLLQWYRLQQSKGKTLNGPLIQSSAIDIAKSLGIIGFKGSAGWLDKFKRRHNISFRHHQ